MDLHATAEQNSWEGLKLKPRHPECPIAVSIDAATQAIVHANKQGVLSDDIAKQRLGTLGLRRIALTCSQEAFGGCPKEGLAEEDRKKYDENFSCPLPIGQVESLAYGSHNETLETKLNHLNHDIGFVGDRTKA